MPTAGAARHLDWRFLMNEIFLSSLAVALVLLGVGWVRHRASRRRKRLQTQGYDLIFSLKTYSAWVDCQRDEPLPADHTDELASPPPLRRAQEIGQAAFPALSQHMLRLLQAHGRLVEYLRQQDLLRPSQSSGWQPAYRDPQYQQIRGAQEDLIEEMIDLCREMIGDRAREWRGTGTDFAFSGSAGLPSTPDPTQGA